MLAWLGTSQHMDALPRTRAEQDEFKAALAALAHNHLEENFHEAKKKVSRAWVKTTVRFALHSCVAQDKRIASAWSDR